MAIQTIQYQNKVALNTNPEIADINKEISKVAFVSNDLTTEYIQLDYDFEIGKTYTIRQKLKVQ